MDGQIDYIKITTSKNLNDDFSGLDISVAGYSLNITTPYVTNIGAGGANDNVFYVMLTESGTPDTGATPLVTILANTTLGEFGSGVDVAVDSSGVTAADKAGAVLISATSPQVLGATIFQSVGHELEFVFSESLSGLPSELNLETALTFAAGVTDGDNLPSISTGVNPYSLVTSTQTDDTIRVILNTSNTANVSGLIVGTHSVQVTDGTTLTDLAGNTGNTSAAATIVGELNDPPTLTATASNPIFTENGAAVTLFSGTSADTVESFQTFAALILTVTNLSDGADEVLGADGFDIVLTDGNAGATTTNTLSYNVSVTGGTATVTLSGGSLSAIELQTLVDTLTYQNDSDDPSTADRVVSLTALKDSGGSLGGGDDTATLSIASTVTVNALNDDPTLANPIPDQPAAQDTPFSFQFAGNSFGDPDGDTLTYTATRDDSSPLPSWLSFDASTRTFSGIPANADVGAITVRVTAKDPSTRSVFDDFVITVANANDAPTDITLSSANVAENADGAVIGNVGAVDPDAGDTHTWSVDDARFEIVGTQLKLRAGQTLDKEAEPTVNLTITATDLGGAGLDFGESFTIIVDNVNEVATDIMLGSANVAENADGAVIGNLGVVDLDAGDTHSWSVDDARFEIVGTQLKLKTGQTLNKETEPTVNLTITATDQGGTGLDFSESFTVTVDNVNEVATDITLSNVSAAENADGAVIGNVGAVDPDAGDTHTWSVDDGRFEIVGTQLKLKAGESLDRESESTVNLTITATDQGGGGLDFDKSFTITVDNVNEAPVADTETYNVTAGNSLSTAVPGVLDGDYDPEGDVFTAVLLAGPANGILILNADGSFNYTPNAVFSGTDSFIYEAWDGSASSASTLVTINVSPAIIPPPPPPPPPAPDPDPDPEAEDPTEESEDDEEDETTESGPGTGEGSGTTVTSTTPASGPGIGEPTEMVDEETTSADGSESVLVAATAADADSDRRASETAESNADRRTAGQSTARAISVDYALMSSPGLMWNELDQQLTHVESQIQGDLIVVGAAGAAASSFTVGAVAWRCEQDSLPQVCSHRCRHGRRLTLC